MAWVIEAQESYYNKPDYFVGFSAGRCFLSWSDELQFALKFDTKEQAAKFAADNRLHCGFRLAQRFEHQAKAL